RARAPEVEVITSAAPRPRHAGPRTGAAATGRSASSAVRFEGDAPSLVTHRRTLRSGLEVIVHPDPSSPQAAVSVWYRVGSSDERADRTGFAHLFKHLFKSPPQRIGGHHYEILKRAGAT